MRPGEDGKRRPLTTDGATNPGKKFKSSLTSQSDLPGLTPEQSRLLVNWIADTNDVPAERLAYVALVEIAEGKYRRRTFLTLAAAQNAVERAEARGVQARITLCELRPVGGTE